MKREFLQNLKVGDQPLTKEIIDAIMEEYGKGIRAEQAKYSDYETLKANLKTAQDTLAELQKNGTTIEEAQKAAQEWEKKYKDAVSDHQREMEERDFNSKLEREIGKAKGRSAKAIMAMLDMPALKESKNQDADITAALENLKKESGFLFESEQDPPGYAAGAGSGGIKHQYTNEEISKMSMDEYRAFRSGKS